MRNTGTRGYSGYRGRRGGKPVLILVLLLILLAAVAFLAVQRYMVFHGDGSYHFELPWARYAEAAPEPQKTGQELEIVIEQPEEQAAAEEEKQPEQSAVQPMRAQELDASALSGSMERDLAALPESINAVAIRVKTVSGDLLYPSALKLALDAGAVQGSSIARSAIEDLTASGRYTIARLSALHDSRFSFAHMTDAAVLQKAYKNNIWYAPDSSFYLAAEKELTREYLTAIAAEVAELGFDELLFDEFGYPAAGRLSNIDDSARTVTMQEALATLAENLRETATAHNVRLSVVLDEATVLNGGNEKSGQELATLATIFDRIYVRTTEPQPLQAALEPYRAELVPMVTEPPADGTYLIVSE